MAFLEWLIHESSLGTLVNFGSRDIYLILLSRFLRMFAYGGAALVLAIYLWTSGKGGVQIGAFLTMTLLGDAIISFILTVTSDKIGRRRVLVIGSLLMTLSGTIFTFSRNYYLLLFAAIVGVISPGAHEVGPFRAVQEAIVAQLTPIEARTDVYAWFAVSSTLGMACGLSISGWITHIMRKSWGYEWKDPRVYASIFGLYAIVGMIKIVVALLLTPRCEVDGVPQVEADIRGLEASAPLLSRTNTQQSGHRKAKSFSSKVERIVETVTIDLARERRGILLRLCILFSINSFASGMLPITLMSWYVNWRSRYFVTSRIGYLMALVWLVASIASLFSAAVARRLGLIRTMVLTHLPHAIMLAFIPLASGWWLISVLLLVSSAFGSMDQAPRMAFVAAVFSPSERTAVMGTLNLVRTLASAGGPLLTGYLHGKKMWTTTFLVAAALKVLYDIGLLAMFLKTKLPERGHGLGETVADVDVGILLSERLRDPDEFEGLVVDDMDEENGDEPDRHKSGVTMTEHAYDS